MSANDESLNENCYVEFKTLEDFDFMTNDYKYINISKTRIISMYKGDTASFDLQINIGTMLEPIIYRLEDDDILKLYVLYPNSDLDSSIIYKEYTKDDKCDDDIKEPGHEEVTEDNVNVKETECDNAVSKEDDTKDNK